MLQGAEFTRHAEVVFHPGNQRLSIIQTGRGLDDHNHLSVDTTVSGSVPFLSPGAEVTMDPFKETYQYYPSGKAKNQTRQRMNSRTFWSSLLLTKTAPSLFLQLQPPPLLGSTQWLPQTEGQSLSPSSWNRISPTVTAGTATKLPAWRLCRSWWTGCLSCTWRRSGSWDTPSPTRSAQLEVRKNCLQRSHFHYKSEVVQSLYLLHMNSYNVGILTKYSFLKLKIVKWALTWNKVSDVWDTAFCGHLHT